ncbi:MAG: TatD family hydrolase [Candidatus Paceibacterales bacterium]
MPAKRRLSVEPFYVKYVAKRMTEIRNVSFDEIAEITLENAKTLFKL